MSHQSFDFEQLKDLLQQILSEKVGAANGDERKVLLKQYLAARQGPFACERMIDVVKKIANNASSVKS